MKLATAVKILDLQPIDGADRIEVASVLGYKVVVQKGLYSVGDSAVFIVPDTTVPRAAWSEFLFKGDKVNDARIRLKTIRLRKQVSQGLLVPNSICQEGEDFTDLLGVEKYEKPIPACLAGDAVGYLPGFLRKTDEDNLRSNVGALAELTGKEVYITKKVDGSSGTFFLNGVDFGVCSRKLQIVENDSNTFWKIAKHYNLESGLRANGANIAIQGEVYGENIQDNKLGMKGFHLGVFDVWDIDKSAYLGYDDLVKYCQLLGVPMVEVIYKGILTQSLAELIELSNVQTYANGKFCEGIVIRPTQTTYSDALGRRLSVKVISENFLVKHGE